MPHRVIRPTVVAVALAAALHAGCGAAEQSATAAQPSAASGTTLATAPAGGQATAAATITMADLLVRALPEVDPRTADFVALRPQVTSPTAW
jgi:hypothetical protein